MEQKTEQINKCRIDGENLKKFIKYLKICNGFKDEIKFRFYCDRINAVFMDPANVCLINFDFEASNFVSFEVDEQIDITFDLGGFLKNIKITKDSILNIEFDKVKLRYEINGLNKEIPLIDLDERECKTPELRFEIKSIILKEQQIENFKQLLKGNKSESVTFETNGGFIIYSKIGSENISVRLDDERHPEATAKYSTEYLNNLFRNINKTDTLDLSFGRDYPLKFKLNNILEFILAPRMGYD